MLISDFMKGMDLPINMIVIVAVAVLVLVVTAGFFGGFFARGIGDIDFNKAFDGACNQLRASYNCDPERIGDVSVLYQPPGVSDPRSSFTLGELCVQKLGQGDVKKGVSVGSGRGNLQATACVRSCGCAV